MLARYYLRWPGLDGDIEENIKYCETCQSILDVMGRGIKEQPPWCMLFADDIVLCSTRRDHVERKLEEWRTAMEERGLKISRRKTEYLGCNEHQNADIQLQGETLKRVKTFTYLG